VSFRRASPPVVNHEREARFAAEVMREVGRRAARRRRFPP
jgi:hippurate hydrolase